MVRSIQWANPLIDFARIPLSSSALVLHAIMLTLGKWTISSSFLILCHPQIVHVGLFLVSNWLEIGDPSLPLSRLFEIFYFGRRRRRRRRERGFPRSLLKLLARSLLTNSHQTFWCVGWGWGEMIQQIWNFVPTWYVMQFLLDTMCDRKISSYTLYQAHWKCKSYFTSSWGDVATCQI